jgi:hypothetical protein
MGFVKKLIELVYYYRDDEAHGKPYWRDPAVIALVVSLLATGLAKWAGVEIDDKLQTEIVSVATGIGALFSPHTGIVRVPDSKPEPMVTDRGGTGGHV